MATPTKAPDAHAAAFEGFRPEAMQFLADLAANNERAWFQAHKREYERLLKEPLEALCVALDERFAARRLPFGADPAKSPFRIYRDVRFSRDKSPYKTNIGASFPYQERTDTGAADGAARQAAADRRGAGGYFHLEPGTVFIGGGIWHPEPARLAVWRAALDRDPAAVHAVIGEPAFMAEFGAFGGLGLGDRLKRVPAGFRPDHPEAELLKLKDLTFGRRLSDEEAFSPGLPDLLVDAFAASAGVLRFIARVDAGATGGNPDKHAACID